MNKIFRSKVLIVSADDDLLNTLTQQLKSCNISTLRAFSGDEAIKSLTSEKYHAVIIDSSLPDIPGIGVCTIIRTRSDTKYIPIVMLVEDGTDFSKVKGMEIGIDDYILKPITGKDVATRIKNLAQRIRFTDSNAPQLQYKDLKIDMASYRVTRGLRDIHLGPTEFKILQCLMESPKRILSRDYIMSNVWGNSERIEPRTIDVHINRLRTALKNSHEHISFIKTIRSSGYCLGTPSMSQ